MPTPESNAKNRSSLMLRTERIGIDGECAPRTASGESGTAKVIGGWSARILGTWSGCDSGCDRRWGRRCNRKCGRNWGGRKNGVGRIGRRISVRMCRN